MLRNVKSGGVNNKPLYDRVSGVFENKSCFSESVGLNDAFDYYKSANYAFTLAEVLITLGVIGIVAAIAIPSLINHYNDKVLETRYKKSKNILVNGFKLMMSNEQVFDVKDLSMMQCNQSDFNCYVDACKKVFKTTRDISSSDISEAFANSYSNTTEELPLSDMAAMLPSFQTTDGMSYIVTPASESSIAIYADINGKNKPNAAGEDFFMFALSGNGLLTDMTSVIIPVPCSLETPQGCKTEAECRNMAMEHNGPGNCFNKGITYNGRCEVSENWADYVERGYCR